MSAGKWISSARFTAEEMDIFAMGIARCNLDGGEAGKWIDCFSALGPELFPAKAVGGLVTRWAHQDYQAAGRWLDALPGGPARDVSVQAYAAAVSSLDPGTAEQWAMTLSGDKDRETTLARIYQNWPAGDAAGKDAFAGRHGIR